MKSSKFGVYNFRVYQPHCLPPDWLAATGQWILIQRRGQFGNPKDFFSKKLWVDYEEGFGDPYEGFPKMHRTTIFQSSGWDFGTSQA